MSPAENAAATVPPALPPADFADWLSPMLVKELRQGVRTRLFMSVFILLQLFMLLNIVLSLLLASTGINAAEGSSFFWFVVAVPTLMIIPLGGLNAIGSEVRANTLELLLLTRLTAFRIVLGKWCALFVQSLLLICAVLPYLVLRYFMGGVNIAVELLTLGAILAGSALLTAVATGLSAFPTRVVRPLSAFLGVFVVFGGLGPLSFFFLSGRTASSLPDFVQVGTVLLGVAILMALMLDVGASRIAPPSENHSAAMRSLAFAGLLVAVGAQAFSRRFTGMAFGAATVAFVVCAVAVCEQPRAIPSLYRPFARWGWPGRLAGKFFYPGWHTGVLFLLGTFAVLGALLDYGKLIEWTRGGQPSDQAVWFVALAGTLLMPAALTRGLFWRARQPGAIFCAVLVVCVVLSVCFLICDSTLKTHYRNLISFLPPCTLLSGAASSDVETKTRLVAVSATTAVSLVVLLIASVPVFRQTARLERESLDLPTPENAARHVPLA